MKREGFVRVRVDGEILELGRPEPIRLKKGGRHTIEAVVDRLVVREGIRTRLADSVETALKWGGIGVVVLRGERHGFRREWEEVRYSTDYGNRRNRLLVRRTDAEAFFLQQPSRRVPGVSRPRHAAGLRCRADDFRPDKSRSRKERSRRGAAGRNGCRLITGNCKTRS